MDTSKHFFQLHGVDGSERPVLRRKLRRHEVLVFFATARIAWKLLMTGESYDGVRMPVASALAA